MYIFCPKDIIKLLSNSDYKMKVGDFSLQLVDATTKEPFKEHVAPSDGQVYAGKTLNVVWIWIFCLIILYGSRFSLCCMIMITIVLGNPIYFKLYRG